MTWLARLKEKQKCPLNDPTKTTKTVSVVFVGTRSPHFPKFENDTGLDANTDLAIRSDVSQVAMGDIFAAREALFMDRGLSAGEAKAAATMLKVRDVDRDERRLCLECSHMYGSVDARRCSQWRQLNDPGPAMPSDLVSILRRCRSFQFKPEVSV